MPSVRSIAALSLGVLLLHVGTAAAQTAELPVKYTGKPTSPEISASDLMTRLYIFADDSMMG
ncbi:MAG: hypothetical protein JWL95_14, partial [Gemmatimonadetes bacterium]|nr:hypothetical protein [Gemmatimonadota bacterium]